MFTNHRKLILGLITTAFFLFPSMARAQSEPVLKVVVSFSVLADMVRQVGGDRVLMTTLVGPNSDAHIYQPTPLDARSMAQADIVFVNGLGFEGWLDRLVEASGYQGELVVVTDGIALRESHAEATEGHEEHEHSHGHVHAEPGAHSDERFDPHAWQSLKNAAVYVANIKKALCLVDAEGCSLYSQNAEQYLQEIDALDRDIRTLFAKFPQEKRRIITSHDAFGYFADEYGLTILAPVGISTESEASARDVGGLIEQIRQAQVAALFIETISDPRLIEQIARETGLQVGGELYADALSLETGPADSYLRMMQHNARQIISALEKQPK